MADQADRLAQNVLRHEWGGVHDGYNYDELISDGYNGYTNAYLNQTVYHYSCSTWSKREVILQLAMVDLQKGTTLEQIVFDCCSTAPIKTNIKMLIYLENGETMGEKIRKILEYQDENGDNCLVACYSMMLNYNKEGNTSVMDPSKVPMKNSADATIKFLIKTGLENGVDMMKVINHETNNGTTLILLSTFYSETVTLMLKRMNVQDYNRPAEQKAQDLLRVELGSDYEGEDYDAIISEDQSGYTELYLNETVDWDRGSTRAKHDVIMELAKVDLKKGTELEKIVFCCCTFAPIEETVKKLILLENGKTIEEKTKNILEYQDEDGNNCLIGCFEMIIGETQYEVPMKSSIEKTIEFLIQLGLDNGVDMQNVINHVSKNGSTLFLFSKFLSEKVTAILETLNVKININDQSTKERAQNLLRVELGDAYDGSDYDELISDEWNGYTAFYLRHTVDWDTRLSRAKHDVLMELAKVDLEKATKLEQLVFDCCANGPERKNIEKLISIENGEAIETKIRKILEYTDDEGYNCLISCYSVLNENIDDQNTTQMTSSILETILFLIQMGLEYDVNMASVINHVTKIGQTLLSQSVWYSEEVASLLTTMNVMVNNIDGDFQIVGFELPSIRRYLLDNGANPHVRDYNDETQYDMCNLHLDTPFHSLKKSVYFTIDGYTCRCSQSQCSNTLLGPWRYSTGVLNGKFTRVIGRGGEGIVLEGLWCGEKSAFKFVQISNQTFQVYIKDSIKELRRRLNEAVQYSETQSDLVVPFFAHYRQQLCYENNKDLAEFLGMTKGQITKYEVFVTKLCDGNMKECKQNEPLTSQHIYSIIDQLVDTLEELKQQGKCHNDVKPGNVLYVKKMKLNGDFEIKTKLADFGMCNQRALGTPGWSPHDFTHDREPGYSDAYSFGLLALYLLAEDEELFYALRDNYIIMPYKPWLHNFRSQREIRVIRNMIDPNYKLSSKSDWAKLGSNLQRITRRRLALMGIHKYYYTLPDHCSLKHINSIESKRTMMSTAEPTISVTTRTHFQGTDEFCWLFGLTTSIHRTLVNSIKESLADPIIKKAALKFLKKPNFHQTLRNEILFGVAPRTLKSDAAQKNGVYSVMSSLRYGGFLRDEGFKQLGTLVEMMKIFKSELNFNFEKPTVDQFCQSGSRQWPVLMVDKAQNLHVVALKRHKTENGKLMLNIRDSARSSNESTEIWIEKNDSPNNQMNLKTMVDGKQYAFYFELS